MSLKTLFSKFYIEFLVCIVLLSELISKLPNINQLNDWCTTPFVFTYKYGIQSRFFIGNLFDLLLSPISIKRLYFFVLLSIIVLILLFSFFIAKLIRKTIPEYRNAVLLLSGIFLASPFSLSFLFYWGNFGRLDLYLIIFTLITLFLLPLPRWRFLTPILLLMGMATHQVFIFTYAFVIIGALFFELITSNFNKKNLILFSSSILITCMAFIYFQFLTPDIGFQSATDLYTHLSSQSNIPVNQKMIEYEYFKNIQDHLAEFVANALYLRILTGALIMILLSPIIIILSSIWRDIYQNSSHKWGVGILLMIPLTTIPAFILTIDWGRWFAALFISQFLLLFFMFSKNLKEVNQAFRNFQQFFINHKLLYICLILYLNSLGKFEAAGLLTYANRIIHFLSSHF